MGAREHRLSAFGYGASFAKGGGVFRVLIFGVFGQLPFFNPPPPFQATQGTVTTPSACVYGYICDWLRSYTCVA